MKGYVTWVLVLVTVQLMAQDFKGKAIYQSKTSTDIKFEGADISSVQKEMIMESMKKSFEKSYELTFDKTGSLYTEEAKLEAPGVAQGRVDIIIAGKGDNGKFYKNVKNRTYVNQTEMFGKLFLVSDSLRNWEWKLTSETKKIGGHICYKAIAIQQAEPVSPQKDAEEDVGGKVKSVQDTTTSNSLLSRLDQPEDRTVTAWYTPEIPVAHGPGPYWGLPGLILELHAGRTSILCSKIVLNPEKAETAEAPSKGKKVSQKEYYGILAKKTKEMEARSKSNSSRDDGHSFSIKIKG